MKVLRLFLVIACSLVVLMGLALAQEHQTRYTRSSTVGKDCEHNGCVQARNDGQVAEGATET
jgi:hypothetical protein